MRRILVESIEDGMVLAKEVCGSSGNTLLNKGSPISVAMGRRLKNWGIETVFVDGDEPNQAEAVSAENSPTEIRQRLDEMFSKCRDNPIMKVVFAAVLQFRIRKN